MSNVVTLPCVNHRKLYAAQDRARVRQEMRAKLAACVSVLAGEPDMDDLIQVQDFLMETLEKNWSLRVDTVLAFVGDGT